MTDLIPTEAKATPLVKKGGDLLLTRTLGKDGAPINRVLCHKDDVAFAAAFAKAFDGDPTDLAPLVEAPHPGVQVDAEAVKAS